MDSSLSQSVKKSNAIDAKGVKCAFTAQLMANYCAQYFGHGMVKTPTGYRVGKDGKSEPGSGLKIDETPHGAAWYDNAFCIGGDCYDLVWWIEYNDAAAMPDPKVPKSRFKEVLQRAAEIVGQTQPQLSVELRAVGQAPKHTTKDENANAGKYDAFMAKYWETLENGLADVAFDNLLRLRGIPKGGYEMRNFGYAKADMIINIPAFFSQNSQYGRIRANSIVVRNPATKALKALPLGADGKRLKGSGASVNAKQIGSCAWLPWDDTPGGDLWLTEGEFDALALLHIGLNARPLKPEGVHKDEIKGLAETHRLFLAYDNDEHGKQFSLSARRLAKGSIDVTALWSEGGDPNDFVAAHGCHARDLIDKGLPELIAEAQTTANESGIPQELEEPLKAMEACRKPVATKSGEVVMEYQRGDIEPLCAWLKARGIYQEEFTNDNGLRYMTGRPLTSEDLTHEQLAIQHWGEMPAMGTSGPKLMKQAAEYVASQNKRDSLREAIANLPEWDGAPRIDTFWANYCGAEYSETTKGVARYMWTAIIGRALATAEQPCKADMCVILKGVQGIGKTSLVATLALKRQWLCTIDQKMPEDEIKRSLRLAQFVEIGEMSEATKAQRESLKRILSAETLSMRKKGVDEHWYFPMRAFFIATSDTADGILNDPNGFRRWLPIDCKGFIGVQRGAETTKIMDTAGIERDKLQLYAEAKQLYMQRIAQGLNGVWWDAVPLAGQREAAERATVQDDNADLVYEWFARTKTREVALWRICADALGIYKDVFTRDKRLQMALADALKLRGFVKRRCRGEDGKMWYWHHPDFWDDGPES